jgi:hypothetical protein
VHLIEMDHLLDGVERRPPATDAAIAISEDQLGAKLPREYLRFLKLTNGGEGFVGSPYVILWSVEDLASMNRSYEVQEYAPGLLIFGSDGGGEAYGFDTRTPEWPIVQVPFVGMAWKSSQPMGASFSAFLKRLSETK